MNYVLGIAGQPVQVRMGPGENAGADAPPPRVPAGEGGLSALNVQGLPLLKPPYGRITAIDLDTGEFVWQIPHGETPDVVRNHPALKGLTIPRTGQGGAGSVGVLVTKSPTSADRAPRWRRQIERVGLAAPSIRASV